MILHDRENVYVTFAFPSREIAEQFMSWMDGAGEQFHWEHADTRGEPKLTFEYDYERLVVKATTVEDEE